MRFTTTQFSFKSGRISKKLLGRIDTPEYREGCEELVGFKPIEEGGIQKVKGSVFQLAASDTYLMQPPSKASTITDTGTYRLFHDPIGITYVLKAGDGTNAYYIDRYDLEFQGGKGATDNVWSTSLFTAQSIFRQLDDVSITFLAPGSFVATHKSGRIPPYYSTFGEFQRITKFEFYYPLDKFRDDLISITNWNSSNRTADITSTSGSITSLLRASPMIYVESLGTATINSNVVTFVVANYYRYLEDITNGARFEYLYSFRLASDFIDPLDYGKGALNTVTSVTWAPSAWRAGSFPSYPSISTIFEGRLVFAASYNDPTTIWGSDVSALDKFTTLRPPSTGIPEVPDLPEAIGILPTDPYAYKIASGDSFAPIRNLDATRDGLFISTENGEYIASGGDTTLSPLSVQIRSVSSTGSYYSSSVSANGTIFYITASRRKVFRFWYNSANGTWVSQELSVLFSDIVDTDQVKELAYNTAENILVILFDSGRLSGIKIDSNTGVLAFFDYGDDDVQTISYVNYVTNLTPSGNVYIANSIIAYKPGFRGFFYIDPSIGVGGFDADLLAVGQTKVNELMYLHGVVKIEKDDSLVVMNNVIYTSFDEDLTGKFPFQSILPAGDQALITWGTVNLIWDIPASSYPAVEAYFYIPGSGEGIIPFSDPDCTITTTAEGKFISHPLMDGEDVIYIGVAPAYSHLVKTVPIEAGQQWGTAQMAVKRLDELSVRHYLSYSAEISMDGESWQELRFADTEGNNTTGRRELKVGGSHTRDLRVSIRNDKFEPCTITGLSMRGVSNDG